MKHIHFRRALPRIAVRLLVAAAVLVSAGNALAGWQTLGNGFVMLNTDTLAACGDGVRMDLADNPNVVGFHPWVFEHVRITAGPAVPPPSFTDPGALILADAIAVLPRHPVNVDPTTVFQWSGTWQVPYTAALPAGTLYDRLWFGAAGLIGSDEPHKLPIDFSCSS